MKRLIILLCFLPLLMQGQRQSGTFQYDPIYSYHDGAALAAGFTNWFDGSLSSFNAFTVFGSNWVLTDSSTFTFTFSSQAAFKLAKIRFYDANGTENSVPNYSQVWIRRPNGDSSYIGVWRGELFNAWKEYDIVDILGDSTEVSAVLLKVYRPAGSVVIPLEIQFVGSWLPVVEPEPLLAQQPMSEHLGTNFYPYSLQLSSSVNSGINAFRAGVFNDVFAHGRFYCDWRWLEPFSPDTVNGYSFTFQSSRNGGWRFDDCLQWMRDNNNTVVFCVKDIPDYMNATYPTQATDNIAIFYNASTYLQDIKNPASYAYEARLFAELTRRYGRVAVDTSLCRQYRPFTTEASKNVNKSGLDLIDILEVGNEYNKNWKTRFNYQTPYEYVARMSAIWDSVKAIDPTMLIAAGGIVGANSAYYMGCIDASLQLRGRNMDGSVNIPWDIWKFHTYVSDAGAEQFTGVRTRGAAPETVDLAGMFGRLVRVTQPHFRGGGKFMPIMIGEFGYDIGNTKQQAGQFPGKTREMTQADWLLRFMFWNISIGLGASQQYQIADDGGAIYLDVTNGIIDTLTASTQYTSSGMVTRRDKPKKRASAFAYQQFKRDWKHLRPGDWYSRPVGAGKGKPGVSGYYGDTAFVYRFRDTVNDRSIYAAWLGVDTIRSATYNFATNFSHVVTWDYDYDSTLTAIDTIPVVAGSVTLNVSEKPLIFYPISLGDVTTVKVTFSSAPTVASVTPSVLPYNKEAALFLIWDDNPLSSIIDGQNRFDTIKMSRGMPFDSVRYSATLAVNGRRVFNNNEIGLVEASTRVQYSQMLDMIVRRWDIANHGWYHDQSGNFNYLNMIPGDSTRQKIYNNILRANDSLSLRLGGYKLRTLVGASNYAWWGDAGQKLGMLSVSGQSDSVFYPHLPVPRVNKPGTYGPMPGYFENIITYGAFYRDFTDAWNTSLSGYKTKLNDLLTGNSSSIHKFWAIGTHGVAEAHRAQFAEFITYVRDQANDRLYVGTMREAMEHRELAQLPRNYSVSGNVLTITIDKATMNPATQFRNLTLLLGTSQTITGVTVNNVPVGFNNTTKLINVDLGDISAPEPGNIPPTVSIPTPPATASTSITVTATVDDPDGTIVSYTWTKLSGPNNPSQVGTAANVLQLSGMIDGTYVYELEVEDNDGATGTGQVTIVKSNNNPPTVTVGSGGFFVNQNQITANIETTDPEGGGLTYQWTQLSGPLAIISNDTTKNPTFSNLRSGDYEFLVVVTDDQGLTDQVTFEFKSRVRFSQLRYRKGKLKVQSKL